MIKKNNPYFEDFIKMIGYSVQAAEYLKTSFTDFRIEELPNRRREMHAIEHAADELNHEMTRRLSREFVTPIERGDIISMASALDSVTDAIEDILIRIYMYNIKELRPEALDFADLIVDCCSALQVAMIEFPNFQKSNTLTAKLVEVDALEEKADDVYIDAVHRLYNSETDPVLISAWGELFDRLEDCCDTCEHVAEAMEIIVMKNS